MMLEIENQIFFFNLVNKGHKVDIFNKERSSIDFFCSRTERVKDLCFVNFVHLYTKNKGETSSKNLYHLNFCIEYI